MSDLQSKSSDLSKCPGCGGPSDNGHDRCIPPNPYYCTKCEADPWENDDTEYVRAPDPGTHAPKTVVCEYVIQDCPEYMPETRYEVVKIDDLADFIEYIKNMTNIKSRSFRVLLADKWEE